MTPGRQAITWKPGQPAPRGSRAHEESRRSNEQRAEVPLTEQVVKSDHGVRSTGRVVADILCDERVSREGV